MLNFRQRILAVLGGKLAHVGNALLVFGFRNRTGLALCAERRQLLADIGCLLVVDLDIRRSRRSVEGGIAVLVMLLRAALVDGLAIDGPDHHGLRRLLALGKGRLFLRGRATGERQRENAEQSTAKY